MASETIAILHAGEMGAAVGACLRARGLRVVCSAAGRSAATRARAASAGLEEKASLAAVLGASDIVLSVCPPHAALDVAREAAAAGLRGVYVDANAVSPQTTREVGRIVETCDAKFVDGGIIGPPPKVGGKGTRLYLSGGPAERLAALLGGGGLEAIALSGEVGAASALKVCYAAWNKGAHALVAACRALAEREGVTEALDGEWRRSQPDAFERLQRFPGAAKKAWRWVAEMEEIAASFAARDLPDGFGLAAAEIYRRLESFKDAAAAPHIGALVAALVTEQKRQNKSA